MTTLNLQVAASADDAHELSSGNVDITSTVAYCYGSSYPYIALRFFAEIPIGDIIDSAILEVQPTGSDDPNCRIYAEDEDDPSAFSAGSGTYGISSRTKTTAYTEWIASNIGTGDWRDSPEIKDVIQEVCDRPGRSDSFHIVLILEYIDSDPAGIWFRTWDYSGNTRGAKLTITHHTGGGLPVKTHYYARMRG